MIRSTPGTAARAALALGASLWLVPAVQAEPTPFTLGASLDAHRESNLLRLATGDAAPAGYSRSDTVNTASVFAGVDQPLGRQRLQAEARVYDQRFARNDVFDNRGYALAGLFEGSTVDQWGGRLALRAKRSLAAFDSTDTGVLAEANLENTRYAEALLRKGLDTALGLEAGVEHQEVDYTAAVYQRLNYRQTTGLAGVRWKGGGPLGARLALRASRGAYPQARFADGSTGEDRYRRTGVELTLEQRASDASQLNLRLGAGRTRYESFTERDDDTVTGALGWIWRPGARLRIDSQLWREPGQDAYFFQSAGEAGTVQYSRVSTGLRIDMAYELSAKVRARVGGSYAERRIDKTTVVGSDAAAVSSDRDKVAAAWLGLSWEPTRSLRLGCDWRGDARSWSELQQGYRSYAVGCNVRAAIEL